MYHNHIDKDYSHPWYTPDRLEKEDEGAARMMHSNAFLRVLFPFYGWAIYLYGMPDGSHFIPFSSQRLVHLYIYLDIYVYTQYKYMICIFSFMCI
jgi:hypothetical protein